MYDVIFSFKDKIFHFPTYADFHHLLGVTSGKRVPENMDGNGNLQDGSIFQASSFASILFKKISLSALDVSNPELPRHVLLLLPLF